ncbi:hypothetical protein FRC02_001125 [Tulasnella sp. 418]|nr:hypothetical protein FRC02_001125 [Tulasnella sp. 418]
MQQMYSEILAQRGSCEARERNAWFSSDDKPTRPNFPPSTRIIYSTRSLQCSHCVREFPNSFTLSSHIQEQHASIHSPASTSFTPSSADSSTPPTPITPSPSRSTVCNGCHNNFWNLKALASHRDGEADPDVKFLCDFRGCGHIACSATLLKGHQDQNKHIINPGPYPPKPPNSVGPNKTTETRVVYVRCEECSQRLRVEDVSKHMDEYHPAFQCTGCEEVFDTSDGLSKHLDSGSLLKEELIVTCPCGAKFSGYAAAHQHIRENAAQPNHLFCFECGLSFETLGDYLCHNDRHHGYRHPPSFPIEAFPNKPEQRYARRLPTSSSSNQNAGCEKVGEKKQAAPIVYF